MLELLILDSTLYIIQIVFTVVAVHFIVGRQLKNYTLIPRLNIKNDTEDGKVLLRKVLTKKTKDEE